MRALFASFLVAVILFSASITNAIENTSWGEIKANQQTIVELSEKLVVSGKAAGGMKSNKNRVFGATPIVEIIPGNFNNLYTNGTCTIFTFKVYFPKQARSEYVDLNSFVFRVFGEGVFPLSLQLWAYHDEEMTYLANYSFNPYIPNKGEDITGGFVDEMLPYPGDFPLRIYPGETLYFRLYADLWRFLATDELAVSITGMNFTIGKW